MKKHIDLIGGEVDITFRKFTIPLAVSFLVVNVYTWVDMYYVSRLSSDAMAAMRVLEQMFFLLFAVASGFAIGSGILIARRFGEKDYRRANQSSILSVIIMAAISSVLAVLFYFFAPLILQAMNIKGEVARLVLIYLTPICFGIPSNFILFHLNAVIRSTGNSTFPLIILISSNILNAIIAPICIFGFGPVPPMGIFGAGIATTISQTLGLIFAFWGIYSGKTTIQLKISDFKIDFNLIKSIFRLGIPATLQLLSVSVNRILITSIANSFGVKVLTTYVFGLGVDLFVFMSIFAARAAIEIITGQNLGANKIERVFMFHKSAVKQVSALLFILAILAFFFGDKFALLFTKNPDLLIEIHHYLKITVFSYIPFAIGLISLSVVSGAGDYYRSFFHVTWVFYLVQIPSVYLLSNYTPLGYNGIWYGILICQIVLAIVGLRVLKNRKWLKTIL